MNDKFADALYRFYDLLCEDFCAFTEDTEKKGLTEGRIAYADTMMHLAKNMIKVLMYEEGQSEEYPEGSSGTTQGYGRAIRTTPGVTGRTMRTSGRTSRNEPKTAYSGDGGYSGRRDSRGRYASSGAEDGDMFSKMQKMADMTANHDEREIIMRMIERLKNES